MTLVEKLQQRFDKTLREAQIDSLRGIFYKKDFLSGMCLAFRESIELARQDEAERTIVVLGVGD